ncbi:MAG: sulfatase-like hydrolase/transferase, partial [Acidimicrobiales bacterium]
WTDVPAADRRMFARQQEVFAGFLTHTDAQIGRLVSFLESRGLLEDTLVLLFSDNGASAEGGRAGSVNEHRFTARVPESVADNLAALDDWGGPRTYNHYSWGWAWAGNTPLRLWKRYTWLGGTRTPLVVHWPRRVERTGEVRSAFTHVVDLLPTVLEAVGIEPPEVLDGVTQQPVDGSSLVPTFSDPSAADVHQTQYFEMLGSRAIFHAGWKATTDHISVGVLDEEAMAVGSRRFEDDRWALFDLAGDFSESTDVADANPDLLRQLEDLWWAEAGRNGVLPIDDTLVNRLNALVPPAWPAGPARTYVPGGGPVADESIPLLFGGFTITADVEVPGEGPSGVLCALGDWNGGYALFVDDGRLVFTFSRSGDVLEVAGDRRVDPATGSLSVTCRLEPGGGGTLTLLHDDTAVGRLTFEGALPIAIQHGGAGLRLGHDTGLPVSTRYRPPAPWNGTLLAVRVETPGGHAPGPAAEVRGALHSE